MPHGAASRKVQPMSKLAQEPGTPFVAQTSDIATPDEVLFVRKRLGLTQKQFGSLFGVTEYAVWRWEMGEKVVPEDHTIKLRAIADEKVFAHLPSEEEAAVAKL